MQHWVLHDVNIVLKTVSSAMMIDSLLGDNSPD